jgi:fatty-acyl-CoA synthase
MQFVTDFAAKRAEISPDETAFHDVATGTRMTFAEVESRANRLARALGRLGAKVGDRIGVLCLNRPDFFVALFAAQKAQFLLVPLNWRQPAPELLPIVKSAEIGILIHDAASREVAQALAASHPMRRIGFDEGSGAEHDFGALLAAEDASAVVTGRREAGGAWYLLYTSGTTGKPKAVIQTFGMAWANAINIGQAIDLTSKERSVNFLPLFHTAGINLYTLPVFFAGGQSHVLRRFEVDACLDLIRAGEVTAFFGVPAIYQAFALHPGFDETPFERVRSYGCGGAPLPEPLIRLYALRGVRVRNGMGMTETGPTVFLIDEEAADRKIGSVGKPQILAEVRLVDDAGRVVEGEGVGELQIRGPGVTPGYWRNEEATRAAFAEDGWLRSGDVARRDADGYYSIVDRIKDMYISGGENVYPAEVENVLAGHPDILEASVIGIPDETWGEVGRAFLMPRPGVTVDIPALKVWCRERLAAYKVPKSFEVVEEFPRTAAGKVQKHVLRKRG